MSYIADDTASIGAHLKAIEAEKAKARGDVPAVDSVYAAGGSFSIPAQPDLNWTSIYGIATSTQAPDDYCGYVLSPGMYLYRYTAPDTDPA